MRAMQLPDDAEICGCNGVCKGKIVAAIKDRGLFTLDEVRKHTKASSSCGSCTGLVEQILMATAGGDYSATPKQKALCGCTDRTHQEARDAIREHKLTVDPGRDGLPRMADAERLRHVPAGAQLLPHLDLAEGREGRSAVALHQRARARQHPEGRHVLGGPADVGRRNHVVRAAPDRRRRRQVRDPDGEGDGRPADRSARREEAGPAGGVAGPRHAVRPRVREGAAHGQDVRRLGVVPLRHAGFDADGQGPRARAVADVRAAQGQARGVRAARATAPNRASRTSA